MSLNASPFHVLLVEDEPADAYLVRKAFEESLLQVELTHVEDGAEALAYLRGEGEQASTSTPSRLPDLILLDLNMPGMNGKSFLHHLKQDTRLCRIPVVVLTTSESEADVCESYALGAAGYAVKPVDIDKFAHMVKQLEEYWFTFVRLPGVPPHER